ncbi:MAG: Glu-tRNA(Gln) amidotransferase subunit GatE [Candidatus Diapherotrites archaeon]|nr:Glu-tRNA(Gln) amidotransferase subunit GatE [Candidatus Diapherotrites archaeon]
MSLGKKLLELSDNKINLFWLKFREHMSEIDYKAIGLKAGLEVHQQLDTGKLFCRCPSKLKSNSADFSFTRKLSLSASELGEFDRAAMEQAHKKITYEYLFFNDCCCLVECDEEPPSSIDSQALSVALQIALMCNANIFDSACVMRKIVLDGSNVSGYQRTVLLATGGEIYIQNKKVPIQTIVLEEDAARPVQKNSEKTIYSLDRLGIPLIEIATAPALQTPKEVKECAIKIGELIRRTCKAKRGLGTIRQDINISIANGARVELKGVQELEMIDKCVEMEVQRQLALLRIKDVLKERKVRAENISASFKELDYIFVKSNCRIITEALKSKKHVFGLKVCGFAGIFGTEVQPGRRFGTEVADYLRARHALSGLFHSDELPKYGITEEEVDSVKADLNVSERDAFVLVVADENKAKEAFASVAERCLTALNSIPEETREALPDGTSHYLRPLPGAARMYPETDLPKIIIHKSYLKELQKKLPLGLEERLTLYKKVGLSNKLAEEMKLSNYACLFEEAIQKGIDGKRCAVILLEELKRLEREGFDVENICDEDILAVLEAERSGLNKENTVEALKQKAKNPSKKIKEIIREFSYQKVSDEEIAKIIKEILKKNKALVMEKKERCLNALMGDVMKELKGKADSSKVALNLKKELMELIDKNF